MGRLATTLLDDLSHGFTTDLLPAVHDAPGGIVAWKGTHRINRCHQACRTQCRHHLPTKGVFLHGLSEYFGSFFESLRIRQCVCIISTSINDDCFKALCSHDGTQSTTTGSPTRPAVDVGGLDGCSQHLKFPSGPYAKH